MKILGYILVGLLCFGASSYLSYDFGKYIAYEETKVVIKGMHKEYNDSLRYIIYNKCPDIRNDLLRELKGLKDKNEI